MRLIWDQVGEKKYETGVSQGVLYPAVGGAYPRGVAWNGLTGVTETPSGAEAKALYADNVKYLSLLSAETFGATLAAFMYPVEFAALDGSAAIAAGVHIGQQSRGFFGLSYKTIIGNDTESDVYGYKIHIIYGAQAAPSEKAYATVNDSPEAITMSWTLTTNPVVVTGFKPTASLVVDSTLVPDDKMLALETILYGAEGVDPRLPLPDEIAALIGGATPVALELSTSVPANAATGVAVGASVVLTFNNKIAKDTINIMLSTTGAVVPCTKTYDATGKILTVKPVSNLTAATKYFVAITGVVDVYSQTLAATVNNFTTA